MYNKDYPDSDGGIYEIIRKNYERNRSFSGRSSGSVCRRLLYFVFPETGDFQRIFLRKSGDDRHTGLVGKYVVQGLAYSDQEKTYLFCGYMTDKKNSRIYITSDGEEVKTLLLQKENGDPYTGHAGGISVSGKRVFISNAGKIFYLSLDTLMNAEDRTSVSFEGEFSVNNRASFTYADETYLLVGEYYDSSSKSYATDESHHFEVAGGKKQRAICSAYKIDLSEESGIKENTPAFILSLPDYAQGIALTSSGKVVVSCSHGISFSALNIYSAPDFTKPDATLNGVPVFYLDDESKEKKVAMPPMSEDIDYAGGQVLVNFESASKKYKEFNLWQSKSVMGYAVD